jgi:hypothetical protein
MLVDEGDRPVHAPRLHVMLQKVKWRRVAGHMYFILLLFRMVGRTTNGRPKGTASPYG